MWEAAASSDAALAAVFENAQPRAGLEDRIIQSLRVTRDRRRILSISPAIIRAAGSIAAVIVVAATGYAVTEVIDQGVADPTGGLARTDVARTPATQPARSLREPESPDALAKRLWGYQDRFATTTATGRGFKLNNSMGAEFATASDFNLNTASGGGGGGGGIGAADRHAGEVAAHGVNGREKNAENDFGIL